MSALARTRAAPALAVATLLCASGCSNAGLIRHYQSVRPTMVRGDWASAAAQFEQAKDNPYGEKDRVMYWLNLGTALHYAGSFEASQANLENAEKAMDELFTKSLSSEASKVLVNETAQSYPGEDFEQVLIYLYTAMNQAEAGKLQDALVEARRADEKLKKMLVVADKEGGSGSVYRQDAFLLWLVGLLYEMEGSFNDAYIAYKAAYDSYTKEFAGKFGVGPPSFLGEDLARTAELSGLGREAAEARSSLGASGESAKRLAAEGEVIIIHGNGEAPFKRERFFDGRMPDNYVMRIAIPEFYAVPTRTAYLEVTEGGGPALARSELAEPVSAIVLKNFELRQPGIQARALARAIVKYAATKGAQAAAGKDSALGSVLSLVGNIAAAATEAADLRSWVTLPAEFRVARVWLPPGSHTLSLDYRDASGRTGQTQTVTVEVLAGQRRLLSVRSVY